MAANDPALNYLPIVKGWNHTVRLYRPRKEILDGTSPQTGLPALNPGDKKF